MISVIYYGEFIYLNMHMEQVYTDFMKENSGYDSNERKLENGFNYMNRNDFTYETIKRLNTFLKKNSDKKIVLDFQGDKLIGIQNNMETKLTECITDNVYVINLSDELRKKLKGLDVKFDEKIKDYFVAFEETKFEYVFTLREDTAYESANGVLLSKYINIKKLIEDNANFFKWCHLLCNNLVQNGLFKKMNKNKSSRPILLAHTLNGACIATIISRIIGLEMIYIDHLGPQNRITGINFPENYQAYQNYLLVVDFICQGNEILRAQNIVEFIGGRYIGFVGMIKLNISPISESQVDEDKIKETVLNISPEDAAEKLEYTIKTKLCCNR